MGLSYERLENLDSVTKGSYQTLAALYAVKKLGHIDFGSGLEDKLKDLQGRGYVKTSSWGFWFLRGSGYVLTGSGYGLIQNELSQVAEIYSLARGKSVLEFEDIVREYGSSPEEYAVKSLIFKGELFYHDIGSPALKAKVKNRFDKYIAKSKEGDKIKSSESGSSCGAFATGCGTGGHGCGGGGSCGGGGGCGGGGCGGGG